MKLASAIVTSILFLVIGNPSPASGQAEDLFVAVALSSSSIDCPLLCPPGQDRGFGHDIAAGLSLGSATIAATLNSANASLNGTDYQVGRVGLRLGLRPFEALPLWIDLGAGLGDLTLTGGGDTVEVDRELFAGLGLRISVPLGERLSVDAGYSLSRVWFEDEFDVDVGELRVGFQVRPFA